MMGVVCASARKEVMSMATSSILENIRVNNPKAVEEFVAAMEASAKEPPRPRTGNQKSGVCSDPERIKTFMAKALVRVVV